ncbi:MULTISPECIES: 5-methyltetrahydropteroyltriglutamate--homocysteine S-methyltransferase [unclassified Beijerinckia]|uniref:5-methyltetrahydropteroyltriglutamate-- homocysteine S-methyltransferase n=1 Tax=unclassified Beijerinckia TaxID=2638183 RepID=UPI00089C223F|nr:MULTISPECIES: 5-methyltetrahydropteroyltriglutamate--homocysteine S-methyltransferase [unclassified Beijerinckia]MDH7799006.1 5-methyltetrahydropteroyltriglutamate--homocysteine methyltransferase [Beijerinckia sp. GAS462]SED84581.1 5-methyltetrahydropteroyltriglutamate--homocysteine methyltransferase [Beijerinckia sp. 28-YEA-48]
MKQRPPFRADHVGSFLRPPRLKTARQEHEAGQITDTELTAIENEEILTLIRKQENVGLKLTTDGEFRRAWWHFDFFGLLDGVTIAETDQGIQFHGVQTKHELPKITGKIGFSQQHPFLQHFAYLKANSGVTPKMTIPAPTVLHFRLDANAVKGSGYQSNDDIFDDLAKTYRTAIKAFYNAGCRYLQLDDTAWAYLCSQVEMEKAKARGINTATIAKDYARLLNQSMAEKPADMTITTHVCRGNFRSTWIAEGGYEPVAEILLNEVKYDGYFLEYDSERAGGFEPLRFLPKGNKIAVVGLITSKSGNLEHKADVKRRLEEAAKYAPLEQLALSPQCGFASTEEGNVLSEEQQWNKMREVVEIAAEVWGNS